MKARDDCFLNAWYNWQVQNRNEKLLEKEMKELKPPTLERQTACHDWSQWVDEEIKQ
jgi:hypothetical protein